MLRKILYPKIEASLQKAACFLTAKKISANQLTIAGFILSFFAGWIYASGHVFLGGIAVLIASSTDLLDGPVARLGGHATKFGAFLDSTLDRYSDFFIFGGLAVGFARQSENGLMVLALGSLAGAFVTSYAKARVENFIPDCGVGVFGRAERILLLAAGSILWPLLPFTLWILFLGTNATAGYRIFYSYKKLAAEKSS
jgi:CDP-diacylglycerol--glycerol-3-phosphate 3-phosphatidyltransferase